MHDDKRSPPSTYCRLTLPSVSSKKTTPTSKLRCKSSKTARMLGIVAGISHNSHLKS